MEPKLYRPYGRRRYDNVPSEQRSSWYGVMITILTSAVIIGVAWGFLSARMDAVEKTGKIAEADHDILIAVQTDVTEIKLNMRDLHHQLLSESISSTLRP